MLPTPTTRRWSISATLSGLRRPASTLASAAPVKLLGERLEAEAGEPRMPLEALGRREIQHAEAARVDEAQHAAVVEAEGQMLVRAGGRAVEQQAARHAEMQQQRLAVVERRQDVLGAPPEAQHLPSDQPPRETLRQGKAQIGAALLERGDAAQRSALRRARGSPSRPRAARASPPLALVAVAALAYNASGSRRAAARPPGLRKGARHARSRRPGSPPARRLVRLPGGAARGQVPPRRRRVRPGRGALRPDERPDERGRPPPVEGGAARLAGTAPRHAPARRRGRHRRHRVPRARAHRAAAPGRRPR